MYQPTVARIYMSNGVYDGDERHTAASETMTVAIINALNECRALRNQDEGKDVVGYLIRIRTDKKIILRFTITEDVWRQLKRIFA